MKLLCLVNRDFYGPYITPLRAFLDDAKAEMELTRLREAQKQLKKEYENACQAKQSYDYNCKIPSRSITEVYKELVDKLNLIDYPDYRFSPLASHYEHYELFEVPLGE